MSDKVIGVDLGATNIRGAVVEANDHLDITAQRINNKVSEEEVFN